MSIRVNGKIIASNGDIKTEVSTDNLVTLDTNQTITSSKTFTIEPLKKSTTVDITVENPETYQQNDAFRVQDKNGKDMGWFGCGQLTSGEIHTTIHSKNKDGYSSIVAACVPQSGTTGAYAYAPNTPENAPDNAIVTVDYVKDKSGSLSIMDVVFAPLGIDESKNKRRYLNGQVIIQSQFPAFTSAVKARMTTMANAFTTETNWQAEKTNSKLGQCGKFVVDDTAGTIRLPCVVNAQGLTDLAQIGGIKSESLPNITGEVGYAGDLGFLDADVTRISGAFKKGQTTIAAPVGQNKSSYALGFDASLSSSTYQDNAPVQQEAIQYPYVIVVNTGVEEAERPINNYQVNNVYSYGMSQYYNGDMNNLSWLKSAGQWNSSTVYAGMYNWLVEQVNAGKSGFKSTTGYQFKGNTAETEGYTPSFATRNPVVGSVIYGGIPIKELGSVTQVNTDGSVVVQDVVHNIIVTLVFKQELPNLGWLTDYDFVINTTDQTFRLPLLNGQEGIFADGVKGNGLTLGLTDGTNNGGLQSMVYHSSVTDGGSLLVNEANYTKATGTEGYNSGPGNLFDSFKTLGIATDSSKSGMVVDKTVPSGYNLYYYVGDTLQNASLINVARIEETLVTKTDKVQAAAASMPSNKYISLTFGASGTGYIAPANGYFTLDTWTTSTETSYCNLVNANSGVAILLVPNQGRNYEQRAFVPCKAGDRIVVVYTNLNLERTVFRFVYAQGDQQIASS